MPLKKFGVMGFMMPDDTEEYEVKISDLDKIIIGTSISDNQSIFLTSFTFINLSGASTTCGNSTGPSFTINLRNKEISRCIIRSGHWIDSIQFEITDPETQTTSMSSVMGGSGGSVTDINSKILSMKIMVDESEHIFPFPFVRLITIQHE